MKKPVLFFSLLSLLFVLTNCNPVEREHERVMDLHDESMLKMSELAKCMKAIEKDSSLIAQTAFAELKQAEDDMWKWMHNYKEPDENALKEVKLKYFAEQYESIKKVDDDINASISNAKKLIEQ